MKRFLSLLLCALMLMSLTVAAFALTPEEESKEPMSPPISGAEPQACDHHWVYTAGAPIYEYLDNTYCLETARRIRRCSCGVMEIEDMGTEPVPHDGPVYNAYCSGGMQTWFCTCNHCYNSYTIQFTCPGKDHRSGCNWLPL